MTDAARSYDELEYPSYPYARTHPARIGAIAHLLGLEPTRAGACRTLELGCGDGANLIAMAAALPGSEFVGVDVAARPLAAGNALAEAAGLGNVQLCELDLEQLSSEHGEFDYVIAHGVYSWVPPRTRAALLEACGRLLSPHGVALVSYNAYPGSHLRDMTSGILGYHLREAEGVTAMVAGARELIGALEGVDIDTPHSRALRDHMRRLAQAGDALLFHDDLARESTPFYFHEFMAQASAHGLQFLSEADPSASRVSGLPPAAQRLLQGLRDDVVVREQYMDFVVNRMFRTTLLCRDSARVRRSLRAADVEPLAVAAPLTPVEGADGRFAARDGGSIDTREPFVQAAMRLLAAQWPAPIPFTELVGRAAQAGAEPSEQRVAELAKALLLAWMGGPVDLWSAPPPVARIAGERPVASPLARAQVERGARTVSSLVHTAVELDPEARDLLPQLDGTRHRASTRKAPLERIAAAGLLSA